MAYLRIFTIAAVLTVACCFTPNLRKENEDIDKDEYKGKTASELPPVTCIRYAVSDPDIAFVNSLGGSKTCRLLKTV